MGNNIFKYLTWLLCKHIFTLSHLQTINFVFSDPANNFFSIFLRPPHPLEWVKDLFYDNLESHCWQRRAWVCDALLRDYHNNVTEVTKQNRLLVESLLQAIQVWNYPNSLEHWVPKSCSVIKLWNVELLAPWLLPWHVVSRSLQRKRAWVGWMSWSTLFASFPRRSWTHRHAFPNMSRKPIPKLQMSHISSWGDQGTKADKVE